MEDLKNYNLNNTTNISIEYINREEFLGKKLLINQIHDNYGYGWKMIFLIISTFFVNYINSSGIYNNSTNILLLQNEFSNISSNLEEILSLIAYISKILGCLTLGFWNRYFLRKTIVMASTILVLLSHLLIIFSFKFPTYILLIILSSYVGGFLEPIAIDNLCESLPIKFRGYFLLFIQTGFFFYQICGFYLLSAFSKNNIFDHKAIFSLHFAIILIMGIFLFFFFKNSARNLIIKEKFDLAFTALEYFKGSALSEEEKDIIYYENKFGINNKLNISFTEIFSKYYICTTILMTLLAICSNILDDGITSIFSIYIEQFNNDKSPNVLSLISFKLIIVNLISFFILGFLLELKIISRRINILINVILFIIFYFLLYFNSQNFTIWLTLVSIFVTNLNSTLSLFLSEIYPSKIRDVSQGYFASIINLGGLIGQLSFLRLFKKNFKSPLYLSLSVCFMIIVLLFFVKHNTQNRHLDFISDQEDTKDYDDSKPLMEEKTN